MVETEYEPPEVQISDGRKICTKKLAESRGIPSFCKCEKCSDRGFVQELNKGEEK